MTDLTELTESYLNLIQAAIAMDAVDAPGASVNVEKTMLQDVLMKLRWKIIESIDTHPCRPYNTPMGPDTHTNQPEAEPLNAPETA